MKWELPQIPSQCNADTENSLTVFCFGPFFVVHSLTLLTLQPLPSFPSGTNWLTTTLLLGQTGPRDGSLRQIKTESKNGQGIKQ